MKNVKHVSRSLALALAAGTGAASAELPAEATAAFTALNTQVGDYTSAAWPIVITLTLAFVGIKLFKKFTNRAT